MKKKNSVLPYVTAFLFVVAAAFSFMTSNKLSNIAGVFFIVAAILFVLSGMSFSRSNKMDK